MTVKAAPAGGTSLVLLSVVSLALQLLLRLPEPAGAQHGCDWSIERDVAAGTDDFVGSGYNALINAQVACQDAGPSACNAVTCIAEYEEPNHNNGNGRACYLRGTNANNLVAFDTIRGEPWIAETFVCQARTRASSPTADFPYVFGDGDGCDEGAEENCSPVLNRPPDNCTAHSDCAAGAFCRGEPRATSGYCYQCTVIDFTAQRCDPLGCPAYVWENSPAHSNCATCCLDPELAAHCMDAPLFRRRCNNAAFQAVCQVRSLLCWHPKPLCARLPLPFHCCFPSAPLFDGLEQLLRLELTDCHWLPRLPEAAAKIG